ncbi:MAG: hypothetical protein LC713_02595, partial [Actinobacteria bacterium]|nr:hypothetical protein [Actinomycetota bacterium]
VQAELLSVALDDAWSKRASLDDALATYHRRRDESALEFYDLTSTLGAYTWKPTEGSVLLAGLESANAAVTERLMSWT